MVCQRRKLGVKSVKYIFLLVILSLLLMLQNTWNWPLIAPLPSYGRGRELPGKRYMSFIHGDGLHDVIITGEY